LEVDQAFHLRHLAVEDSRGALAKWGRSDCQRHGSSSPFDCSSTYTRRGKVKPMANRLAGQTSPYLLQHEDNPVEWYPWGGEALTRAKSEDRPLLVSIGYSACHWCHVMEHESFEDPATAAYMNEHFVCIKV